MRQMIVGAALGVLYLGFAIAGVVAMFFVAKTVADAFGPNVLVGGLIVIYAAVMGGVMRLSPPSFLRRGPRPPETD